MAQELTDIGPIHDLLQNQALGIFSDIDGTLAPIVPNPQDARITPRCRELLLALTAKGVRIALITGRPLDMARAMTELDDSVAYAAWHGLELRVDGRTETQAPMHESILEARQVIAQLGDMRAVGVTIEPKGPGLAFHYRRAGDEEAARRAILEALAGSGAAQAFRMHQGRKVIELRAPLGVDKGTALTTLVEKLRVSAVLCLGDDETDIDMFRALSRLGEHDVIGISIAVESAEVAPEVLDSADYFVRGVAGVEWLLGEALTNLRAQEP